MTPRLQARKQVKTRWRTEQWRQCQHERSQTRVLDSMLVATSATGRRTVSLPKEANREARFGMAMERARAKEHERAIHEFQQSAAGFARASMLHDWASLDTRNWSAMLGNVLPMSALCEKVMTFTADSSRCRTWSGIGN